MAEYKNDGAGLLMEAHKGSNPRLQFFYIPLSLLLLVLAGGLVYQQVLRSDVAHEQEKVQSQRRIIVPGPRGNIYDREGRLLVGNRPRFSAVIYLDELHSEIYAEQKAIREAYLAADETNIPAGAQLRDLARYAVVQRYLKRVDETLGRETKLDARALYRHFSQQQMLPFPLIDDLEPAEYAKLLEQLPVGSPLQVYTSSTRHYPYGPAAAHALGFVSADHDFDVDEAFPGVDLRTFKMIGTQGRNGLELQFEDQLEGEAGGTIYRVDPQGFRVKSLQRRLPVQGENLVTSLDIDLQRAAEENLRASGMAGAAVALDVNTGEVLVMTSMPDYNLNDFAPRLSQVSAADIAERGAWINRAAQGLYPPGSTFKILSSIAGLRSGAIVPDRPIIDCQGVLMRYRHRFVCYNGQGHHGEVLLPDAIAHSCDIYFYEVGWLTTPTVLAAEARRFGFGEETEIDLPHETHGSLVPDPAWKKEKRGASWVPGDTANMAIGQGDLLVTPLQMATFVASVARGQTRTHPYLVHDPERPVQNTEPIGISPAAYGAILRGMEDCTLTGTARVAFSAKTNHAIPGLRVAGKTGTAQKRTPKGTINFAWFICFAPIEHPQIAIAVVVEGDTPGEETGGGLYSAPAAHDILLAWTKKHPELVPQTPPAKLAAN